MPTERIQRAIVAIEDAWPHLAGDAFVEQVALIALQAADNQPQTTTAPVPSRRAQEPEPDEARVLAALAVLGWTDDRTDSTSPWRPPGEFWNLASKVIAAADAAATNTTESAEDAARRFAGELERLRTELQARGIPPVDGGAREGWLVDTALTEIDRLRHELEAAGWRYVSDRLGRWAEQGYPGTIAEALAPTTGAPYGDEYQLPPGCTCHWRADIDYGDVRTQPPGGCPVHNVNTLTETNT